MSDPNAVNSATLSSIQHQATSADAAGAGGDSGTMKSLMPFGLLNAGVVKQNESGSAGEITKGFSFENITGTMFNEKSYDYMGGIGSQLLAPSGFLSLGIGAGTTGLDEVTGNIASVAAGPGGGGNPQDGDGPAFVPNPQEGSTDSNSSSAPPAFSQVPSSDAFTFAGDVPQSANVSPSQTPSVQQEKSQSRL